jgi:hypothetical protein
MSEVRLQSSPTLYTPYQSPFLNSPANFSSAAPLSALPSDGGQCLAATPEQLFTPNASYLSDPAGSASLTQLQSDTAASITGGSGNSEAGSFDWRLRSEQGTRLMQSVGETGAIWGPKGGGFDLTGKGAGALANALTLPASFDNASKEFSEGNTAGGLRHTFTGMSNAVQIPTDLATGVLNHVQGTRQQAARTAFTQAAPKASPEVVKAASEKAAQLAMEEAKAKAARRGVTEAAETAAKKTSTLAQGAGKAATKAVAKSGLKTAAKAAGRFVPGANIAIAGLDTAAAVATLADPKANVGQKVTSVITAAGSIVAATNIPVVSQVGAAVSAVSSFIGSFF